MGFFRNLTTGEIIDQVLQVRRATGRAVTNVVFMGMGEPMLNYDNVVRAAGIITSGIGIAARHITVSTAGWAEGIRRLGDERRKLKLAVSLHSAVEKTRLVLMPVTKRYGLADLRSSLEHYYAKTGIRVTYEVIFFEGINDSKEEIAALIRFARHIPSKINVIPFHSIAFTGMGGLSAQLRPSPAGERIAAALRAADLTVLMRSSSGEDIQAACGQLALASEWAVHARRASGRVRPAQQSIVR
jgi:23S rRNA (adenine2503-C2)-methyltransferase